MWPSEGRAVVVTTSKAGSFIKHGTALFYTDHLLQGGSVYVSRIVKHFRGVVAQALLKPPPTSTS